MARLLGLLTAVVGLVLVATSPSYAQKVNTAGYKAASLPCASGVLLPVIPSGSPYISAYVACNQFVTTASLPGLLSTPGDPITFVGFDAAGHIRTSPALGGGSVTSVGISVPSWLQISGTNPITVSGTFAITASSQSANLFLASPSGSPGVLAPRAITAADINGLSPTFGALTVSSCSGCSGGSLVSITAGNAGVVVSPSPLTGTGSVALNIVAAPVSNQWVSSITAAGVATMAPINFNNLTGSASAAQMVANLATAVSTVCSGSTVNFVRGDGTCTTPAGGGNVNTSGSISVGALGVWASGTGLAGTEVPGTGVLTALANPTNAIGGFVTFGSGTNPTFGALTVTSCTGCGGGGSVSITAGNAGIVFSPSTLTGTGTASLNITGGGAVSNQWVNSISAAGVATLSQPGFASLSGSASAAQMSTNLSGAISTLCSASTTNFVRGDGTCVSPGGGGGLTVGTTAVASGTNYGLLFNNTGNVLGNTPVLGAGLPLFGNGAANPPVVTGTLSGNTTKLVTQGAGSTTSGHQLVYDASGNAIDGGSPGSGGTVTSITAGNAGITLSPSTITTTGTASLNITGGGAVSNQFVNSISAAGVATLAQPAFTNLSGSASAAQMATNLGAAVNTAFGGGTTNFVRADGTAAVPPGTGGSGTPVIFVGTTGGTSTAYTAASTTPSGFANTAYYMFCGTFATANGASPTLSVGGQTARPIEKTVTPGALVALSGGEINGSGGAYCLQLDSSATHWILQNASGGGVTILSTASANHNVTVPEFANGQFFIVTAASQTITFPVVTTLPAQGGVFVTTVGQSVSLVPNSADGINGNTINTPQTVLSNTFTPVTTSGSSGVNALYANLGNSGGGGGGISGLTTGQVGVAGSSTTLTSSVPFGLTGNSTLAETTSGGLLTPSILPLATNSAIGGMKGDGTTIDCATVPGTCASTAGVTNATTSTSGTGASPTAAQFNAGWVKNLNTASLTATFPAVSTLGANGLVVVAGLNAGTIAATSPDTITSGAGVTGAGGSVAVGAGCSAIVSKISTGLAVSGNLCAATGAGTGTANTFTAQNIFSGNVIPAHPAALTATGNLDPTSTNMCGGTVEYNSGSAGTLSVLSSWPVGCNVSVTAIGTGLATIAAGSGTVHSACTTVRTRAQYSTIWIRSSNTGGAGHVDVSGDCG